MSRLLRTTRLINQSCRYTFADQVATATPNMPEPIRKPTIKCNKVLNYCICFNILEKVYRFYPN